MEKKYFQLEKKEILEKFNINEEIGLKRNDLKFKEKKYGLNQIEIKKDETFLEIYFKQIKSFLNLLLVFLSFFSLILWIYTNRVENLIDSIIVFLIFLFNTLIGAYQNYSAKEIAKTLNKMLENKALVLRNGKKIEINARDLFPGDIIFLNCGDKVPADAYLLSADELKVDESILTGESLAVDKVTGGIKKDLVSISDMKNIVFMNTYIISGETKAIVIGTGKNTEIGKIATSIQNTDIKSSFVEEIDEASKKISYFAIALILIVSIILFFKGIGIINIFLVASALIIGSIPEGLPAIVVFSLSRSVHKLAKNKILVKDMSLLETLGSINILCTDKTGTLTENKMFVKKLFLFGEEIENFSKSNLNSKFNEIFIKIISYVNNIKKVGFELEGDPEDVALINFLDENNLNFNDYKNDTNISNYEPFNSLNKFTFVDLKKEKLRLKKGAAEILLKSSKYIIIKNKKIKLNSKIIQEIEKKMLNFTDEALRLIGFSYMDLKNKEEIFLGFVGLYDKPKVGIENTIKRLYEAHIEVKMITGDNINTASSIAKECGFKNIKAISLEELMKLNKKEFEKTILSYNVFARATPEMKSTILEILQKHGNRVAITGDGVNDSIALKKADVGVVMGSGSDIAKESGDLILINNDFRTITKAINEGRGIFHNIKKVVNYLLTANLAEVLAIFIASFFGIIPFTAIQILWVNFVTDVAPSMSLGLDKFPDSIMKKKPNGKNEKILDIRIILLTIFISLKKVFFIFLLFFLAYKYSPFENKLIFAQTISFTWLVLSHFVRIAAIRFDEKVNFFSNKYVNYSLFFVVLLQLIIIYTPIRDFFQITYIPIKWVSLLIIFILFSIFITRYITLFIDYLIKNIFKEKENY